MKRDLAYGLDGESHLGDSLCVTRAIPPTESTTSCSFKRIKATEVNGCIVYTRVKKPRRSDNDVNLFDCVENKGTKSCGELKIDVIKAPIVEDFNNRVTETVTQDNLVAENVFKESPVVENVSNDVRIIRNLIEEQGFIKEKIASEEGSVFQNVIEESQLVDVVVQESPLVKTVIEGSILVETVNEECLVDQTVSESEVGGMSFCNSELSMCKEEPMSELELQTKEGVEVAVVYAEGNVEKTSLAEKARRRYARSVFKPKEELMDIVMMNAPRAVENEALLYLDGEATANGTALTTLNKNLELKMSKKIALNKKPTTVKELFETGLLEGVSVVYMGGSKAYGLRGTIKDSGILCSCAYCKGCRVIPPSQFEIHACKQYRRASQYICFENGKSLLDVMRACRSSPLHTLEATLQSALSSLPEEKYFTCRRCKGSFPITCVGRVGPLCNLCVDSKKSGGSSNCATGIRARRTKPVLISRAFRDASVCISPQNKSQWKLTAKDQLLHKLVFDKGGLPDGTEVGYYARGQQLLEGYKMGLGIFCRCCNCEVSPSQFEAHAGWASRRKPYAYIYTSNGVSLHELALSLSKGQKYSAKDNNDDLCIICADGGNLLRCDGCPRAFHKECASLSTIPRGDWYCNYCQNMFEREKFVEHIANALAAGRVSGVDPIEQISKRCIRIVRNIEAELSGCVLCRAYDFSKSGFNPRTILLCDQCEREYHVGCLKTFKMADLKELPKGKWFCCMDCSRIHSTLQKLLVRGAEKLPDHLLDAIKKKHEEKGLDSNDSIDVRWRLLSGNIASAETRLLLAQAVAIFHDCFDPIIDTISGRDLIPSMVYGRNSRGQEYGGMYCAILMVNSFVVSAGILRVFGRDVAELPLVATSKVNHGKGYFQMLFSCIEKLLAFLNVKSLVLPAAEEAESIWTDKFGFKKIKADQLSKYRRSCCQMVTFKGTSMLQKMVPACRVLNRSTECTDSCGEVEQGNQILG
ncbi:PHD domain-containing protein [Cephalotus follicularis]|uniref:PHD domain-containing protein n=1 Tax=Cephalotus follicularis TaxID=3775 RepID=A0A1Q3ATL8_CEPFO|nr:PHD domain-containing protein [Cephalotus follicularis]